MAEGPTYYKRTRGLFDTASDEPFKISRSKIDLFVQCPRCFYLDRRLGVPRPSMPGFTLNVAVDALLKKEFDTHREKKEPHPMMTTYGIDAIPFEHKDLDMWRNNFKGVQYHDTENNLFVFGAIDDVWQAPSGELYIVDYKATSKKDDPDLEGFWQQAYKRQMEVYQWLFRQNGFTVSNIGYFVYVNGKKDVNAFDAKLEFDVHVLPYEGDDAWVPGILEKIRETLMSEEIPPVGKYCEHCPYREEAGKALHKMAGLKTSKRK